MRSVILYCTDSALAQVPTTERRHLSGYQQGTGKNHGNGVGQGVIRIFGKVVSAF